MEAKDRIKNRLDVIDDNLMAISGLSRMLYGLKLEAAQWVKEDFEKHQMRTLELFCNGLHDLNFARAIEKLAEDAKDGVDALRQQLV